MPYERDDQNMTIARNLQHPEQYGDYLRSQADFLQSLTHAMDVVHGSEEPARVQYDFEFFLGGAGLELPASVADYCGSNLQHGKLSLVKEADQSPTASLELLFLDEKNNRELTFYISRDPELIDSAENDVILVGADAQPQEVERVPKADINAIVLSLVTGEQPAMSPQLEQVDIFSADSHTALVDALQRSAHSWQKHVHYALVNDRDLRWSTSSNGSNEVLSSCQFSYTTGAANGSKVVVDIDPRLGLVLEFKSVDEQGNTHRFSTETGDLLQLQEAINDVRQHYDNTEVISIDPLRLSQLIADHLPQLGE